MYSGGAIFSDHATGLVHVEHQVALTSHETLQSKHKFEAAARDSGVIIQTYRSDNGSAFSAADYAKELATFKQISSFAGVGAHHHNGVAERSIQTIMSMARTVMLHAAIRWPDTADSSLWPMAVDYAVYIHNHMPNRKSGLAPIDLFSGTKWPSHKCRNLHVWGSPTYVLDSAMQDGKKLPRWTPRSRRAVFVGLSNKHASTAPLVLNLKTGHISPQFHCVFDSWFTTVDSDPDRAPDPNDPVWSRLFGASQYQYYFDDYEPPALGPEWSDAIVEQLAHNLRSDDIRAAQDHLNPIEVIASPPIVPEPTPDLRPLPAPNLRGILRGNHQDRPDPDPPPTVRFTDDTATASTPRNPPLREPPPRDPPPGEAPQPREPPPREPSLREPTPREPPPREPPLREPSPRETIRQTPVSPKDPPPRRSQ